MARLMSEKHWSVPKNMFISGQDSLIPEFIGDKQEKIQSMNLKKKNNASIIFQTTRTSKSDWHHLEAT